MENYYSIVRFVSNPLSDENIALGLLVVSSDAQRGTDSVDARVMHRISAAKVSFAKKLNPGCAKLLDFSLKQLDSFLRSELQDQSNRTVQFPIRVKHAFLERLSSYNNGLLQFSKPRLIDSDTLASVFDEYYDRFIEPQALVPNHIAEQQPIRSRMEERVIRNFYQPLLGKIDVDYTLHKQQLPSLFFDYHLEGLGVNGAMYAVKALDLNGKQQLDTIQKEIVKYESVIDRLNLFAEERKISGEAHYYLVTDPYQGSNQDRRELYSLLSKEAMPSFKVISSEGLPKIVQDFQKKNVRKFSEIL